MIHRTYQYLMLSEKKLKWWHSSKVFYCAIQSQSDLKWQTNYCYKAISNLVTRLFFRVFRHFYKSWKIFFSCFFFLLPYYYILNQNTYINKTPWPIEFANQWNFSRILVHQTRWTHMYVYVRHVNNLWVLYTKMCSLIKNMPIYVFRYCVSK